ncbi:Phytanoyl-CoA dioxygenase (PhyH) [Rosistilla oblonga]|uniref:phytanoyl-CoA dioxygenase family protein n=1 Tax=Rosistilla oblonga TaxID=2527990 RepID=UPI001188F18C|nr:phytanoyl-CoA dioxygenase family protein [Rosistilla oblonga]QDV12151.1 Phytanoyl-CoA dioxygenase (PhyH) [Rosistilla oblonga]
MATDYSTFHEPTSDLFERLAAVSDLSPFRLTDEQIAHYHEFGYLAGVRILDDAQIEHLRAELAELVQPDHDGRSLWYEYNSNESSDPDLVLFHALGAWRTRPGFHDMLWNPAFLVAASQLLGGAVRFWHDQLFCKPAHHGGVVAWHQDYSYWTRTQPMAHLTCWIGLDDATADNGCLQYVPGSHRWPLLPITGLAGDMQAIGEVLSEQQMHQLQNPTAIELKAGECAFHHPLMVHGSFANRTDRPRRAAVLNVVRDGVCSAGDKPLLDGTDPVPAGQPLAGRYFPLLFDGERSL